MSRTDADVIIAGAGPAGATLAILLGRAGLEVELYEQHVFPRDKPCAEGLMPAGVAVLQRLGLADAVGGVSFGGIRYFGYGRSLADRFPDDGIGLGRAQRRLRLDAILFAAARSTPGVRVAEGTRVEGPIVESGRVRGVTVAGESRRARLVVAADGPRSVLRRRLGLDARASRQPRIGVRRHYRLARGQIPPNDVEIHVAPGLEIYLTPLPDGEISVAALAPREAVEHAGRFFETALAGSQRVQQLLEGAEPVSELGGRMPLAIAARRAVVPGFALLGDADLALDPITGGGMAQAMLTAELLAAALVKGGAPPGGARWDPSDDALEGFDRARRLVAGEALALSRLVLTLVGKPRVAAGSLALLRRWPALFRHLLGVAAGTRRLVPL